MKQLANTVKEALINTNHTLAVAESCSGGYLGHILTNISGSSKYFLLGIIAYSNKTKISLLGVPSNYIKRFGAVSKQVAISMSCGIRKRAQSDYAIGITGIAGPTGGTAKKPQGTVFISVSSRQKTTVRKFIFSGNRITIKKKAAAGALKMLIEII